MWDRLNLPMLLFREGLLTLITLVGKSPHHINSTQDFVEQAKHFKLEAGECLSSYDVSALFTSVPIDPALNIIKDWCRFLILLVES